MNTDKTQTTGRETITLFRGETVWLARHSSAEIKELFGSDTLPTAYGAQVEAAQACAEIKRLNPDCVVICNN